MARVDQRFIVTILHQAEVPVKVVAINREAAKKAAWEMWNDGDSNLEFKNLKPEISKVVCLGVAQVKKNVRDHASQISSDRRSSGARHANPNSRRNKSKNS